VKFFSKIILKKIKKKILKGAPSVTDDRLRVSTDEKETKNNFFFAIKNLELNLISCVSTLLNEMSMRTSINT